LNLAEYRTRIARVSGMSTASSADTALMDAWVNEGIVKFLVETKMHTRLASLALTADQGDYTLDTDILAMQALWYEPSDNDKKLLERVAPETLFELRLPQATDNTTSRYYAISGAHTLMLYPDPPSSSDLLHLLYVPRPAALSSTADTPSATANGNIPEEYHDVIEAYALWKAARAEEHKGSDNGLQFQSEYERAIAKIRGEIQRKAGVVQPSVRIGRPRRFPVSPGVDAG
jgi:hypothetical protein